MHPIKDSSPSRNPRPQSVRLERLPARKAKPIPSLMAKPIMSSENLENATSRLSLSQSSLCTNDSSIKRSENLSGSLKLQRTCSLYANSSPRMDESGPVPKLVTLPNSNPIAITVYQVAELLKDSPSKRDYDKIVILDARFEYEYQGGHINGAINLFLESQMETFRKQHLPLHLGDRLCIIIHCEFSSHRGPKLFRCLRETDRNANEYPNLNFPEMYLLQGGYKEFYEKFPELCTPNDYIPMLHPDKTESYAESLRLTRSSSGSIKSLKRSNSDAFSRLEQSCPSDPISHPVISASFSDLESITAVGENTMGQYDQQVISNVAVNLVSHDLSASCASLSCDSIFSSQDSNASIYSNTSSSTLPNYAFCRQRTNSSLGSRTSSSSSGCCSNSRWDFYSQFAESTSPLSGFKHRTSSFGSSSMMDIDDCQEADYDEEEKDGSFITSPPVFQHRFQSSTWSLLSTPNLPSFYESSEYNLNPPSGSISARASLFSHHEEE